MTEFEEFAFLGTDSKLLLTKQSSGISEEAERLDLHQV
jgi:hypothetical protein